MKPYSYELIVFRPQAPTWLKDELKDGIGQGANFAGEDDDGISSVGESAGAMSDQESDEEVFIKPKKDVATKKPAISQEKTYAKYRAKAKGVAENKIVGGVAIAAPTGDASANSNYGSYESNTDTNVSPVLILSTAFICGLCLHQACCFIRLHQVCENRT